MKKNRPQQVSRVAKKLAQRDEKRRAKDERTWGARPMRQKEFRLKRTPMVAYDLETTLIEKDKTPDALYLTAYSERLSFSGRVKNDAHLLSLLETHFLLPAHNRCRFVAWNGNNFDVYIVSRALLLSDDYILRPYLTRSKSLRGLKVIRKAKWYDPVRKREVILSWEFLDGISMTGLVGVSLKKFLTNFAPDYGKLEGPDFENGEKFDCTNKKHVEYAERDSEGLYRGMIRFEDIVAEHFSMGLQPTVGNLGIKIFQMNMPADTTIWKPSFGALSAIRNQVLRGGFCFRSRRFKGAIWKYDLNQAYAAAMRETRLPAGRCLWNPPTGEWKRKGGINLYASVYIARVRGTHPNNTVPFYCRDMEGKSVFATTEIPETWITSIEHKQLLVEGAKLETAEAYYWDETFSMKSFVDRLESGRVNAEGGPSGAIGTVFKNIGNHSYGKTVEQLDGLELMMAMNCPEEYSHYQSENDRLQCVWYRFAPPVLREYHQPQIGSFITAYVRMVMRRAILIAPDAWLYSDTDCNAFDRPIHQGGKLDIDPKRYGAWKLEVEGDPYLVIEKKVYASLDGKIMKAKGLSLKKLSLSDFESWFNGRPPEQKQVQRVNYVSFIAGRAMFKEQKKTGQQMQKKTGQRMRLQ